MNTSEFVSKWRKVELTERSASQQHFLDLCEVFSLSDDEILARLLALNHERSLLAEH